MGVDVTGLARGGGLRVELVVACSGWRAQRPGRGRGASSACPGCARVPCDARTGGAPWNSLRSRLRRSLRSDIHGESVRRCALARAAARPALLGCAQAPRGPAPAFAGEAVVACEGKVRAVCRHAESPDGDGDRAWLCCRAPRTASGAAGQRNATSPRRRAQWKAADGLGAPPARASQGTLAQRGQAVEARPARPPLLRPLQPLHAAQPQAPIHASTNWIAVNPQIHRDRIRVPRQPTT